METKKTLTEADLRQFTGSEVWYRHSLNRKVLYTEGTQYVAENAGAYWLLDEIACGQLDKTIAAEGFQVWKLTAHPGQAADLTCEDGNGRMVFSKQIEFTDFPLAEITLWLTDNVILLPSEY